MRVAYLVAGAGGMYCGSCLHDNRLAATLIAQGRDVVLIPLYTPLRTDEEDVSQARIYYGGLNVYLQHVSAFFRRTPWFLNRLLDWRPLLRVVSRLGASTRPEDLGALTLSVMKGEDGAQHKELERLVAGLRRWRPNLVCLPNLMFVTLARRLKDALGVKVVCGLAGEDIFLDSLLEPYRREAFELIRTHAADADAYVAPTRYYSSHAAKHFGLPAERVRHVPMGIRVDDFAPAAPSAEPFTIGYLARICPEKGLAELCVAFVRLRQTGRPCLLRAAGHLGRSDRRYLERVRADVRRHGMQDGFDYVGEVDWEGKIRFLQSLHALSVPTTYAESKGFYVLEALAAGVPVVLPAHGSLPELVEQTGGGLLYPPGDTGQLADALGRLMDDTELRRTLADRGRQAVRAFFSAEREAEHAWRLFEELT